MIAMWKVDKKVHLRIQCSDDHHNLSPDVEVTPDFARCRGVVAETDAHEMNAWSCLLLAARLSECPQSSTPVVFSQVDVDYRCQRWFGL